ncbi:MAG: M67 family metallopeptidase [Ilumatobacteraceae bacterium]
MSESAPLSLSVPADAVAAMGQHAIACYPEEMCGLLVGKPGTNEIVRFVPCTNIAHSALVYTIDPKEHLRAELAAEAEGLEILGCAHSHTHTEAYPSKTDVDQAPDPNWHYIIVSLKTGDPRPRSFLINGGSITEETLSVA